MKYESLQVVLLKKETQKLKLDQIDKDVIDRK